MEQQTMSHIRNIALLDHEGAGETTLLESMLHFCGATQRMGHVDDHNTISDFDPDEKELEKSLYCSTVNFSYKGLLFNCLDVPGSADAIADAMTSLHAVEAALVCIDATDGIKANTRRMWRLAAQRGIPRLIAITKLDADNSNFQDTLNVIKAEFGNRCIPLYLPDGSASSFSSIHSILHDRHAVPEGAATYEQIVEAIVETDDALMEAYLEGDKISEEQLLSALKSALLHGAIFPVIPTSGEKEIGTGELLQMLCQLAPAPEEIEHIVYSEGEAVSAHNLEGFAAYIYRTESNEFVGRISYARILSGSISAHDTFINRRSGKIEKAGHIFRIVGKNQQDISKAAAGDLIAIPRVDDMHACDIITDEATNISMDEISLPKPMVSLAIRPKTNKDGQKLGTALHEFANDDRSLQLHADPQTHDLIISGTSEMHLQLVLNRLNRRYKVHVETSTPQVPYRETITGKVSGIEYTHKKQSGGAGQFGRIVIDMEPLERGKGYQFSDNIHGGVIDAVFRASVDKGVQAGMTEGVLAGFPVTDLRVTLVDGKTHSVDSKDIAFQIAGHKAFKQAFLACKPTLLEPIVKMEITIQQDHIGDIMGDLNARRAQILSTNMQGSHATVQAMAPLAEVQSYQAQLKSMTAGEGIYSIAFDHYDQVPAAIQKKILAKTSGTT